MAGGGENRLQGIFWLGRHRPRVKWVVGLVGRALGAVLAIPLALFNRGFEALSAIYSRQLAWVLAHPLVTVGIAFVLLAGSLALVPRLGRELVPELIQGEFFVNTELPPGTHLDVTQRRMAGLERFARVSTT